MAQIWLILFIIFMADMWLSYGLFVAQVLQTGADHLIAAMYPVCGPEQGVGSGP